MKSRRTLIRKAYRALVPEPLKPFLFPIGRSVQDKIEQIKSRGKPTKVNIETTTYCTRECYYCPRDPNDRTMMDESLFYSIVNQLCEWEYKGRIVPEGFGDPFCDKRMVTFISYIRGKLPGSEISLSSSGDLLNETRLMDIFSAGLNNLRISINDPSSPERISKLKSLENLFSDVHIVDMRDGYRKEPLFNRAGSVYLPDAVPVRKCPFINYMYIRADGLVVICNQDYEKREVIGDIKEQGLAQIWDSSRIMRDQIKRGDLVSSICQDCGYQR